MSYMQLKPTMRYAKQSGGAMVVVKKLRPDSNELSILQHLHSFAPSHNYVLPLLSALELDVGTFIFVPEATPLELGFTFKMFCNKRADFSRQLIDGIAFLHRWCGTPGWMAPEIGHEDGPVCLYNPIREIGRASCRERVSSVV